MKVDRSNLKIALTLTTIFIAIAIPVAVIASTFIWSPEITVTVSPEPEYQLTISQPPDGTTADTYTFTGVLTVDGSPMQDETVTLYIDEGVGFVTTGLTDTTAVDGSYSITWTPSVSGTFTFKTLVEI